MILKKRFANDVLKVLTYLEREWDKKTVENFKAKIQETISLLATHPYTGAPSLNHNGLRGISVTSHNRLFYRIRGNTVFIVFLADTRRKTYET